MSSLYRASTTAPGRKTPQTGRQKGNAGCHRRSRRRGCDVTPESLVANRISNANAKVEAVVVVRHEPNPKSNLTDGTTWRSIQPLGFYCGG
jgi:hypothetical protein